jgi:hypothetical protein
MRQTRDGDLFGEDMLMETCVVPGLPPAHVN